MDKPMTITLTYEGEWYDWTVSGDSNARDGEYCGAVRGGWEEALASALSVVAYKKRHPYQPRVRTEY